MNFRREILFVISKIKNWAMASDKKDLSSREQPSAPLYPTQVITLQSQESKSLISLYTCESSYQDRRSTVYTFIDIFSVA